MQYYSIDKQKVGEFSLRLALVRSFYFSAATLFILLDYPSVDHRSLSPWLLIAWWLFLCLFVGSPMAVRRKIQNFRVRVWDDNLILGSWPADDNLSVPITRISFIRETPFGLQIFEGQKKLWIPKIIQNYTEIKDSIDFKTKKSFFPLYKNPLVRITFLLTLFLLFFVILALINKIDNSEFFFMLFVVLANLFVAWVFE